MPIKAGVADQLSVLPGAEQHPVLAGLEEAAKEGAIALLSDGWALIEALVGGDHRQQALQLLCCDRPDLCLNSHGADASASRNAALTSRDAGLREVNDPTDPACHPV